MQQPGGWSITDWDALSSALGVIGFFLSFSIPIGVYVVRRILDHPVLRVELVEFPGKYRGNSSAHTFRVFIHHESGPAFRLERVSLYVNQTRTLTDAEREAVKARGTAVSMEFPGLIQMTINDAEAKRGGRPLISPGETVDCQCELSNGYPWELTGEGQFIEMRALSQGQVIRSWDLSEEFRPRLPWFIEWRRGNGQNLFEVERREFPLLPPFERRFLSQPKNRIVGAVQRVLGH